MARPLRMLIPGGDYHVTCRGNQRKLIFKDDADRSTFNVTSLGYILDDSKRFLDFSFLLT